MKIKHVYGNVLRIDIPLTIKIRTIEDGTPSEREEPFYPDATKGGIVELANNYNRKIEYKATINDNIAHIEDNGNISIGKYKVTVKCYDADGNPYRYMVRDIVEICDATADAGIEAGVEFNAETYTLEGAAFISYGGEQVQSDWTETDPEKKSFIKHKPDLSVYATKEELENVEGEIPELPENLVTDANYVHTDNNYTSVEKEKLAGLENYDDSEIRQELDGKVDKVAGKGLSTNDFTNEDKSKLNSALQSETDPTVPQWAKQTQKPTYTAQEVGALSNSTKYGSTIDLAMDSATYVLTLSLKDQDGTVLNTKTVDLPIESVVVNGRYDAANKKIVLTLQSGSTIDVPVGDLIAGLQTEITSVNMLDADLVDDTNSTHKFVTEQEKTTWSNKQDTLVSGTNIKTVNNQSILGAGNIDIQGSYTPTLQSAPTSSTTTYTKDGQVVNFEIGQFARVAVSDGYDFYQLRDLVTENNVTTAIWMMVVEESKVGSKEDVTTIETPVNATDATLPITALICETGKYYRIDVAVDTLGVTLPAMTDLTTVRAVVIYLTGGTAPAITITSTAVSGGTAPDVHFQYGYEIASGNTYEISCLWNGNSWIVGDLEISTLNS